MTAVVIDHEDIPLDASSPQASHVSIVTPMMPPVAKKHGAKENVNRPDSGRWTQQNLGMWEPMLTLNWSITICFLVAGSCILLGLAILIETQTLSSYRVVYDAGSDTNATDVGGAFPQQVDGVVEKLNNCRLNTPGDANSFHANHTCFVTITLREPLKGSRTRVFYELDGFHQHHRRFVSSMDRTQFTDEWRPDILLTTCEPMQSVESVACDVSNCPPGSKKKRDFFPCGIVANTMFNDIFWLHQGVLPNGSVILGPKDLSAKGAARTYPSHQPKNPTWPMPMEEYLPVWRNPNFSRIIPPVHGDQQPRLTPDYTDSTAWVHDPLDPERGVGTGLENEHWRVWVETAAIQPFRKAYGFILSDELPAGTTLVFAVQSNFYVRSFAGTKAIVIGELSWFGSDNVALAIFFLGAGAVFSAFLLFFLIRRCTNPRRLGDASALAWKHKKNS